MAEQGYMLTKDAATRTARAVVKSEGAERREVPGPAPILPGVLAIRFGKANGAIKKIDGKGTGKVDVYHYNSNIPTGYAATGEKLTNVNLVCVADHMEVPDEADVICVFLSGPFGPYWFVIQSYPCPQTIPDGSTS